MAALDVAKENVTVILATEDSRQGSSTDNEGHDSDQGAGVPDRYRGTSIDRREMSILGKKQVLRVSHLPESHPSHRR
jgi:hypothetical protein